MFGGVFGKSHRIHEHKHNTELMFLPCGTKTPRWRPLKTKGNQPEPRFHHGMHFYEKGNYLVVFGGRKQSDPTKSDSEFVSSISILRVDSLEWLSIKFKDD